jgi:hypothetical protein
MMMAETTRPATMREMFGEAVENMRLMLEPWVWRYAAGLQPLRYDQGVLTVAAPEPARSWCERRLDRLIRRELRREAGRDVEIRYVLAGAVGEGLPVSGMTGSPAEGGGASC